MHDQEHVTVEQCVQAIGMEEVIASSLYRQAIENKSSMRAVAERLGLSPSTVIEWCNPESAKLPSGRQRARLMVLCPDVYTELLHLEGRLLALRHAQVVLTPEGHMLLISEAVGATASAVRDAIADGHITTREAASVCRASSRARAAHTAMERDLGRDTDRTP